MAVIRYYEERVVSIEEVTHAIEKLDFNKACGSDGSFPGLLLGKSGSHPPGDSSNLN